MIHNILVILNKFIFVNHIAKFLGVINAINLLLISQNY